jgi:hypothetical protein
MPEQSNQNVVIIEEINSGYLSLACTRADKGDKVCFFRIDKKFLEDPVVQKNLTSSSFIDLSKVIFDYMLLMKAMACAHKNLEPAYDKFFKQSSTISITKKLLDSVDVEDMYKKEILLYLSDLYYIELRINAYIGNFTGNIEFYSSEGRDIHSDNLTLLSNVVNVVNYNNFRTHICAYHKKIQEYGNLFYPIYILLKKIKWISTNKTLPQKYLLGINANLPALFSWNYHYPYYLIDEIYGIPKDQIIFIDETYRKDLPLEFEEHGFAYINFLHRRAVISFNLFKQIIYYFIPAWCLCLVHAIWEEKPIIKTTRLILTDYIRWNILMDTICIKNHVTILLPDTISKNLIFTRHGTRTLYIYPDNYTGDYHTGWDEKIPLPTLYAFIHADFAVIFGNKIQRYFSYNRNTFKKYLPVGVITAQRIDEIRQGKITSNLPEKIKEKMLPKRIIGVFDTSFVDYGPVKIKDGIQFGNDILRLLDDFPDIGIIFKEKKFLSVTPELAPVYEKLEQHPRCIVVRKTEHDCIFSTDVIAVSDLVISAAYTSTNAEALGAKTKAIYYDVAGTDIGDKYYFNRFPNLVAHNYDELKRLVKYWLYEITPEEFESYLMTYVKDEIDPYMDGKAIDRLQNLLRND